MQFTKILKPLTTKVNLMGKLKVNEKLLDKMLKNIIYLQLPKSYNYV